VLQSQDVMRPQDAVVGRSLERIAGRSGGAEGNARLTGTTGALLIGLLAVEGVTILFIRPLISVHVFVGLMLVPPVALKLGATGWRFFRYYTRSRSYVLKGPPHVVMRVLVAPPVVLSTLFVFGTGIAMFVVKPGGGILLGLHKASFVVWLVTTGVHVLVYLPKLPRLAASDLRRRTSLPSGRARIGLVVASVAAGAIFAAATFHLAAPWLDWVRLRH
jgi:hypothetical protein